MKMKIHFYLKIMVTLILANFTLACGSGGGGDGSSEENSTSDDQIIETISPQKSTKESLASPEAEFKTYKKVSYMTYNQGDHDITLYIYGKNGTLIHRTVIPQNSNKLVNYNISIADTNVIHTWRFRENVLSTTININNISSSSFTSFL